LVNDVIGRPNFLAHAFVSAAKLSVAAATVVEED
jgi:hypothetical protein